MMSKYGLISKILCVEGKRDELSSILAKETQNMPGCESYVIAKDVTNHDAIWITEIWETKAAHQASLSLPSVQQAIVEGRPMIAEFAQRIETQPL